MNERVKMISSLLDKLSDLAFQEDVWIEHKYNDVAFDLGETVNLLDDYNFFEDVETGKIKLGSDELNLKLLELIQTLENYKEPAEIKKMTTDKNWLNVVGLCKELKIPIIEAVIRR